MSSDNSDQEPDTTSESPTASDAGWHMPDLEADFQGFVVQDAATPGKCSCREVVKALKESLRYQTKAFQHGMERLAAGWTNLKAAEEALLRKREELHFERGVLQAEGQALHKNLDDVGADEDALDEEWEALDKEREALIADRERLRAELADLEQRKAEATNAKERKAMEAEQITAQAAIDALRKAVDTLAAKTATRNAEAEVRALTARLATGDAERKRLQEHIRVLERELAEDDAELEALHAEIRARSEACRMGPGGCGTDGGPETGLRCTIDASRARTLDDEKGFVWHHSPASQWW
ncbi:hypothetical protein GE09DRAFT_47553 [Coniochaeta sp. 2T2.1]|nr:hypothetical protein GE09DRAFT_47553 [Coniochaeta sp. 2T2.1]